MKKCVSCTKDLPDTAVHCVFCGAKQGAPAPAGPPAGESNKTVMGYSAADLLRNLPPQNRPGAAGGPPPGPPPAAPPPAAMMPPPAAPPPAAMMPPPGPPPPMMPPMAMPPMAPPPAAPPPAAAFLPTAHSGPSPFAQGGPMAPPPGGPPPRAAEVAATAFAMPSPFGPGGPPGAPPPMGPPMGRPPAPMGPPPPMGPPMGGPMPGHAATPASAASTMFMDGGPPKPMGGGMPSPMGGGMPMGGSPVAGPMQSTMPAPMPSPMQPMPMPQPMQPMPMPQPMQPMPMPMAQPYGGPSGTALVMTPPPYLASQSAARAGSPVDPYRGGLQLVLLIFGVILLAGFVTPLTTEPKAVFWWDILGDMEGKEKVVPILLATAGLLGVLLGAIPLPTIGRAAAAAGLGIVAILYPVLALPEEIEWQSIAFAVGSISLVAGLLLRDAYRDASLGRILTTIGAIAALIPWFVPEHDKMPIQGLFDMLSDGKGAQKAAAATMLLYPVLALVSLIVWIPGPSSAGGKGIAWMWILTALIIQYTVLLAVGHLADVVKHEPYDSLFAADAKGLPFPIGVVASAYVAFAGYGLAALLGKNLERG